MLARVLLCIYLLGAAASAQPAATTPVPVSKEPAHRQVFENQYVRVFEVEIPVGGTTLLHRHDKDYIVVTLGDSEVSNERQGATPAALKFKEGDTMFVRGGYAHVPRNLGDKPYRNVTVEILPSAGSFTCGPGQGVCGGGMGGATGTAGVAWKDVVKTEAFVARQLVVGPQSALSQHEHKGPHLVIAISNLRLRSDVEGNPSAEISQNAGDIKWVPGGFTHSVTNVGPEPARFVTLEFH